MTHRLRFISTAALFLGLPGCGLDYYLGLAGGALGSIARTRPIEQALADPSIDEALKAKLRFVQEVRQFGIDVLGQNAGRAYTLFDDDRAVTAGGPIAYSLSASARDSFTPYVWYYPIIGPAEYRGYFSRDQAMRDRDDLRNRGYDTYLGTVAGFSTLGVLPDPIRASQLEADEPDLALLILHELTHTTVYKNGDTTFNETFAQFVGREGARQFFIQKRGADSAATIAAMNRYDDGVLIDEFVRLVHDRLAAFYAEPISSEEKIAGRQAEYEAVVSQFEPDYRPRLHEPDRYDAVAELPLNNAIIAAAVRYQGDLPVFSNLLDHYHGDFRATWDVVREAITHPDSYAYLTQWLADHP